MKQNVAHNEQLIKAAIRDMTHQVIQNARAMSAYTGLSPAYCARMIAYQMAQPGPPRFVRK